MIKVKQFKKFSSLVLFFLFVFTHALSSVRGFFVEINRKSVYIDKKSNDNVKKLQNREEKWQN